MLLVVGDGFLLRIPPQQVADDSQLSKTERRRLAKQKKKMLRQSQDKAKDSSRGNRNTEKPKMTKAERRAKFLQPKNKDGRISSTDLVGVIWDHGLTSLPLLLVWC